MIHSCDTLGQSFVFSSRHDIPIRVKDLIASRNMACFACTYVKHLSLPLHGGGASFKTQKNGFHGPGPRW